MKNRLIPLLLLPILAACTAPQPKFKDMTEFELISYNRTVDRLDQVFCTEEVGIGSHIRRMTCMTLRDILEGHIGTLDTPGSSYSVSR